MIAENTQSSFWWIKNEISFHFIMKTKIEIWTFEKEEIMWA